VGFTRGIKKHPQRTLPCLLRAIAEFEDAHEAPPRELLGQYRHRSTLTDSRQNKGHSGCWNREMSALFPCSLAFDAVPRPRNGFQPFRFYVAAAFGALAETPLPHPL